MEFLLPLLLILIVYLQYKRNKPAAAAEAQRKKEWVESRMGKYQQKAERKTEDKTHQAKASQNEFSPYLTSQLVALRLTSGEDKYKDEYHRRLKLCGIKEEKLHKALYAEDERIIRTYHKQEELSSKSFAGRSYFSLVAPAFSQTQEELIAEDSLTPSEVIKIFDEAEWHVANSHEREISDGVWGEVFGFSRHKGTLLIHMTQKLMEMGLTIEQAQLLMRNDQFIIGRTKWGYDHRPHPYN